MPDLQHSTMSQRLNDRRGSLRAQLSAASHWRRLVRAKIDLTVARAAGPNQLLPIDASEESTRALNEALGEATTVPSDLFELSDLPRLRELDELLTLREAALRRDLMEVTDQLVQHLAEL
ncbi:hypothetical protein [Rarobacter incanus]|uniref:Uncharacterized protein n=1 Tax=Rarobacter incanus TaxID=153494 RepID=A0A542SPE1_9MICO|nr:hypothetical protein [Rarobacter incanus]TQK76435.1 hypothetical protein FB389_1106 [Rarobacter incanus]